MKNEHNTKNERLISKRKERELKQWQLAQAVKISVRYYQKIEAGTNKPNVETAISIAENLGCNVTDLFGKND